MSHEKLDRLNRMATEIYNESDCQFQIGVTGSSVTGFSRTKRNESGEPKRFDPSEGSDYDAILVLPNSLHNKLSNLGILTRNSQDNYQSEVYNPESFENLFNELSFIIPGFNEQKLIDFLTYLSSGENNRVIETSIKIKVANHDHRNPFKNAPMGNEETNPDVYIFGIREKENNICKQINFSSLRDTETDSSSLSASSNQTETSEQSLQLESRNHSLKLTFGDFSDDEEELTFTY